MKIAVIGSRDLCVGDLTPFLPPDTTEIVSGGARGVDESAQTYARTHGLRLSLFYPDYEQYGRLAPIRRNADIVAYADKVLAFWNGTSRGTKYVIDLCRAKNIPIEVYYPEDLRKSEKKRKFSK